MSLLVHSICVQDLISVNTLSFWYYATGHHDNFYDNEMQANEFDQAPEIVEELIDALHKMDLKQFDKRQFESEHSDLFECGDIKRTKWR